MKKGINGYSVVSNFCCVSELTTGLPQVNAQVAPQITLTQVECGSEISTSGKC